MTEERIKAVDLTPCVRCKRPLLREHLPIIGLVKLLTSEKVSLESAVRAIQHAHVDNIMPPSMLGLYGNDTVTFKEVDLESYDFKNPLLLCFRCDIALRMFLRELTEEEQRDYEMLDQMAREG